MSISLLAVPTDAKGLYTFAREKDREAGPAGRASGSIGQWEAEADAMADEAGGAIEEGNPIVEGDASDASKTAPLINGVAFSWPIRVSAKFHLIVSHL